MVGRWIALVGVLVAASARAELVFGAVTFTGGYAHLDAATGDVTIVRQDLPERINAMTRTPDGSVIFSRSDQGSGIADIYMLDPLSGDHTLLTSLDLGNAESIRSMAFDSSGVLYLSTTRDPVPRLEYFARADLASGAVTHISQGAAAQGMAHSPIDGGLYFVDPVLVPPGYAFGKVDRGTGSFTTIASGTGMFHQGLTFLPDGRLFAVGDRQFAQLDPASGTVIGGAKAINADFRGLVLIPEPASLCGLAVCSVALRGRRR